MQTQTLHTGFEFQRILGTLSESDFLESKNDSLGHATLVPESNVFFLHDYLNQGRKNTNDIIIELQELLREQDEWKQDGVSLQNKSINFAIKLVQNSIIKLELQNPELEVHPDGEIAFTWRKKNKGIINIAFSNLGIATWAAFLEIKQEQTIKGSFKVEDKLPDIPKTIIELITGTSQENECLSS